MGEVPTQKPLNLRSWLCLPFDHSHSYRLQPHHPLHGRQGCALVGGYRSHADVHRAPPYVQGSANENVSVSVSVSESETVSVSVRGTPPSDHCADSLRGEICGLTRPKQTKRVIVSIVSTQTTPST